MSSSLPLANVGPDILREILALLDGRDLITLSQTSRQMAALVSEAHWQKIFERDFSFQGLAARKVILARHPGTSWRDCYASCSYRNLVIWGSLEWLSADPPCIGAEQRDSLRLYSLDKYRELQLPSTLIVRDIVCVKGIHVLSIDGRVSSFKVENENSKSPNLIEDSRIDNQPGPFIEISMTTAHLLGLDIKGDWWSWDCSEGRWMLTFEGKKIWPGTLHVELSRAVALSDCGRYVYLSNGDHDRRVEALPCLSSGPPLKRFDNFIVSSCSTIKSVYLVCLQVNRLCYTLFLSCVSNLLTSSMYFPTDGPIVEARLWHDEFIVIQGRDRSFQDSCEFELICANGTVIQGCKRIGNHLGLPRLTFSERAESEDINSDAIVFCGPEFRYELTKMGEIYGEGTVYAAGLPKFLQEDWPDSNRIVSCGYTEQKVPEYFLPRGNQGSRLNQKIIAPPLTSFHLNKCNASALALPPNESFPAGIESDNSVHLEVIQASEH